MTDLGTAGNPRSQKLKSALKRINRAERLINEIESELTMISAGYISMDYMSDDEVLDKYKEAFTRPKIVDYGQPYG